MNASKFKRMLKSANVAHARATACVAALDVLKASLENELASTQAIGIASAAPAKAKRVKAERPAKAAKAERNVDRPAKVKTRKADRAALVANAKPAKQKKLKTSAPTDVAARRQKASRHEKIAPALVKRGSKQRGK